MAYMDDMDLAVPRKAAKFNHFLIPEHRYAFIICMMIAGNLLEDLVKLCLI